MRKLFLLLVGLLTYSCYDIISEDVIQSSVESTILPIDGFTGEIAFVTMEPRQLTFLASFTPSATAKGVKIKFDATCRIPEKEDYMVRKLADYDRQAKITCVAAYADSDFKLTCDRPFLDKEPGADLSSLFMVYPLAEFTYPDFSLNKKCYKPTSGTTLYAYLAGGSVWMQKYLDWYADGLLFAPVTVPDVRDFSPSEIYTFTLFIPLVGLASDGKTIKKIFEGTYSVNPTLPGGMPLSQ